MNKILEILKESIRQRQEILDIHASKPSGTANEMETPLRLTMNKVDTERRLDKAVVAYMDDKKRQMESNNREN
jgi:hypothetical protein